MEASEQVFIFLDLDAAVEDGLVHLVVTANVRKNFFLQRNG